MKRREFLKSTCAGAVAMAAGGLAHRAVEAADADGATELYRKFPRWRGINLVNRAVMDSVCGKRQLGHAPLHRFRRCRLVADAVRPRDAGPADQQGHADAAFVQHPFATAQRKIRRGRPIRAQCGVPTSISPNAYDNKPSTPKTGTRNSGLTLKAPSRIHQMTGTKIPHSQAITNAMIEPAGYTAMASFHLNSTGWSGRV